jgi:hypothetical protein
MPLSSEEHMVRTLEIVTMLKCEKCQGISITHGPVHITYFVDLKDGTEITIDAVEKELSKLGPMCLEQRSEHTGHYYPLGTSVGRTQVGIEYPTAPNPSRHNTTSPLPPPPSVAPPGKAPGAWRRRGTFSCCAG